MLGCRGPALLPCFICQVTILLVFAGKQAATLKLLAESFRIPVVVVNQVTAQMQGPTTYAFEAGAVPSNELAQGQLTAALGVMWAHAVNTRLVLETIADVRYIKVCLQCQLVCPSTTSHHALGLLARQSLRVPAIGSAQIQPTVCGQVSSNRVLTNVYM